MNVAGATGARSEWKAGWPVVMASMFGFAIPATYVYSVGALIAPLQAEYGWSRAQITAGLSILTLTGGLLAPVVGIYVDRWGPRRIALPGALAMFAAYNLITLTTSDIRVWWGLWFLMTFAALGVKPGVWTTAVASTFEKSRGLAMAAALCGSGIGSALVPILATLLIDRYGWRSAVPMLSGLIAVVIFPILWFGMHSGADRRIRARREARDPGPALTGVEARQAFLSVRFVKIAFAGFVFTVVGMGLGANIIPIFTSFGMTRAQAAQIAGVSGMSAIVGRLCTGWLLDRFNANLVGGLFMLLPVASFLILLGAPGHVPMSMAAIFIFGLTVGAEIDIIAFLTAQQFGTMRFGTIFGAITGLWSLATATGPLFVSYVFDATGSYVPAIRMLIPTVVSGALCILFLGRPPAFDEAPGERATAR